MAEESRDNQLREMARHRGLKLVKSRRRKPGTGDFGKYGLTDDKGKPLLGIGENGLTASADDVENYLRAGTASSWQQSAKVTPDNRPIRNPRVRAEDAAVRPHKRPARRDAPVRPADPPTRASLSRQNTPDIPVHAKTESPREEIEPTPQPRLVIRIAKLGDTGALAELLCQLTGIETTRGAVADNLAASRKSGGGIAVAELGVLIGCCCWVVIPTLHRGPVGRITALIVAGDHRRQGIGSQLLAAAEKDFAKKGCGVMEVMSDIDIRNSHNFFRTLKFEQASYRFIRKLDAKA